jgi:hypothetical protein
MAHSVERRSKHRQDVGASSSDPSNKPKKVAKRPRPRSYQEESSPEASPPHGSTPDETECLKMYPPVMHLRNKPCYSSSKERDTDERFWTFFHQDWYQTVLYPKSSPVVK